MILFSITQGILIGIFTLLSATTYIHENCHKTVIKYHILRNKNFRNRDWFIKCSYYKSYKFVLKGITLSNYLYYLNFHIKDKKYEIKHIAISGSLYTVIIFLTCILINYYIKDYYYKNLYITTQTIFITNIFLEIYTFFTSKNKQSDKERFLHPERYFYPYSHKPSTTKDRV